LYQTDLVPVGEDQRQHLELTRDLAIRFNRDYGETFKVPEPFIPKLGARIMSLSDPTRKMAKSDDSASGCIMLLDDDETVRRKFKRAVTDSGTEIRFDPSRPAIENLLTIYQLMTGAKPEEIEEHFRGKGYASLKSDLAESVITFLRPLKKHVEGVSDAELDRILNDGREKAQAIAASTIREVKARMGIKGANPVSRSDT
jgi:tryptophanyl-tRNA synthetase